MSRDGSKRTSKNPTPQKMWLKQFGADDSVRSRRYSCDNDYVLDIGFMYEYIPFKYNH